MTDWNPEQYERFEKERAAPFDELVSLVRPPVNRVIDLGCGTGRLTAALHRRVGAKETLGVDRSPAMLREAAAHAGDGLRFEQADIADIVERADGGSWDLVLSNAALHWLDDHATLFAGLAALLAPGGQLAIQVPFNASHPSFQLADKVAAEAPFSEWLEGYQRTSPVLEPEAYAGLLHDLGFVEQHARLQVFGHLLPSADAVFEWNKGALLRAYEARLDPEQFAAYLARYRKQLREVLGEKEPYFFTFRRILMWGRLSSAS